MPGHDTVGINQSSVPVVIAFERTSLRHADVGRLLVAELGKLHTDLVEMQPRDLLVELLGSV